MLDVFNTSQPTGCNIQTFYGVAAASGSTAFFSWTKPRGVSNIYMLLIGGGGNGDGTTGGGSGAVSVWYGAAQNIPDILRVNPGVVSATSRIATFYSGDLIIATGTISTIGAVAAAATTFTNSGFYQSVAGQNGSSGGRSASPTTFLGGGGASNNVNSGNYNYKTGGGADQPGFFLMQPIIVGVGGTGDAGGSYGCGGGLNGSRKGGPGLVLIASW
jgi:hypothetical protein